MLKVNHVYYQYPTNSQYKGLRDISFSLELGEAMILMGESGCGKSTLLNCIAGLVDVTKGEMYLNAKKHLGPSFHLTPTYEDVKLVNSQTDVMEYHTCVENINLRLFGHTDSYKKNRIQFLLQYFELKHVQHQKAKFLSSGQRQRLSLARSLAKIPKLLLLDEPFSNLDFALKQKAMNYIHDLKMKQKISYILVTHQLEDAMLYGDTIASMKDGKIIQKGTKDDLYYHPKTIYTASLLGDFNSVPNELKDTHRIGKNYFFRPNEYEKINQFLKINSPKKTETIFNGYTNVTTYFFDNFTIKSHL